MKSTEAPDANPITPNYIAPPGACDAHCHIFGPEERYPYAANSAYKPGDVPWERVRALHAHLGLSRAVLVQASCHGTDNRAMLDAIADSQGNCRGVALVGKDVSDRELHELHVGGVRGIRYNFVRHLGIAPAPEEFRRTVARIRELGWHVELHLDAVDLIDFADLLADMPVPFVIDHMGRVRVADGMAQAPFQRLLRLLRENPNAWVKISGAERISAAGRPFRDAVPFAASLIAAAPERVLWGTDFPHPNLPGDMPNDGELLDLLAEMCPDERHRHQILVDNPSRLYWADRH